MSRSFLIYRKDNMNIEHYIRVGRLLAELHGDETLSEQQCAKIMGVDLVSWRIIEHTFSRGSWGETVDESGPTSEEAIRAALSTPSAPAVDAGARDELASMTRMFGAACADLGAINKVLGLDPEDGGAEPIIDAINELKARAALSASTGAAVSGPVEPAYLRLRKAADEVCACLGYHGEISNRDDRVVALVDALYGTDDGNPETAQPVYCTESSALKALRNLRDALRDRHYGRMPEEVQRAYDDASAVIATLSARTEAAAGAADPVAYVCEHATHPGEYARIVSFEQTGYSKDFVCRPLFYGAPVHSALREALQHIVEYWNRDRNEDAMYDALEHMIETAAQALESETHEVATSEQSAVYETEYVRQKFSDYQSQIDGLKEELEFVRKAAGTQRLDKPAMVGGVRFGAGVEWSTVIGAAQRLYEYEVTPEKEANRIAMARETLEYIRTGEQRHVVDEDGLIGSAIDGDALIEAVFNRTTPFTYKSFGRALLAEWTATPKVLTVAGGENASLTEEDKRDLEEARKSLQCFSMSTGPVDRILARRSPSKDLK